MKLKIGNFARICQVPVSALRYYDEAGLIRPAQVDKWTGYRYYDLDQVSTVNRILALKDLGLALEQIRQLMRDEVPAEQLRTMLRIKQAELEEEARELHERLARVETRIQQIEQEGKMPDYDVVVKRVEPVRGAMLEDSVATAWVRGEGSLGDGAYIHLFDELAAYMRQQGLSEADVTGPTIDLWYDAPDSLPEDEMRVAVFIPTNREVSGNERVRVVELPEVQQMASVVHRGSYATIGQAYRAFFTWMEQNGYELSGPSRGVYLKHERGGNPEEFVTELQFPVTRVGA